MHYHVYFSSFLFLQYLQEPTGTYETRHLRFPQFKMVQEAKV